MTPSWKRYVAMGFLGAFAVAVRDVPSPFGVILIGLAVGCAYGLGLYSAAHVARGQ